MDLVDEADTSSAASCLVNCMGAGLALALWEDISIALAKSGLRPSLSSNLPTEEALLVKISYFLEATCPVTTLP